MKDIAARAGVSISTVSHVLNNTRPVAKQTRERVLQIAQEANYYRNAFGRRLARGRADAVGLIISEVVNPFFPELIRHFETAAVAGNLDTLICTTHYDPGRASHAVRRMIENRVQGVAVMTSQFEASLVEELAAAEIPLVRLDAGAARRGRSAIWIDYQTGAKQAVQHLSDFGHRQIAFISGSQTRVSAVRFRDAIVEAVVQAALPQPLICESDNTVEGGAAAMKSILESGATPSAVICGHDLSALGVLKTAADLGLDVPGDLSVIGADDIPFAVWSRPPLTSIRVPRDELGATAFKALDRMIRGKRCIGREYTLQTVLVVRGSTGPANRAARVRPKTAART